MPDVDLGPLGESPFSRRCIERVDVQLAREDYDRILHAAGTLAETKKIIVPGTVTFTSCDDSVHTAVGELAAHLRQPGPRFLASRQGLAADLFLRLGIPTPRVGFGEVTLKVVVRGVYSIVETPGSDFVARWFESTSQLVVVENSLAFGGFDYEVGPEDKGAADGARVGRTSGRAGRRPARRDGRADRLGRGRPRARCRDSRRPW